MNPFYVVKPGGERVYFSDIKKANEFAQKQANELKQVVIRHDDCGGQSWFKPEVK
jgi:hypothetical protein